MLSQIRQKVPQMFVSQLFPEFVPQMPTENSLFQGCNISMFQYSLERNGWRLEARLTFRDLKKKKRFTCNTFNFYLTKRTYMQLRVYQFYFAESPFTIGTRKESTKYSCDLKIQIWIVTVAEIIALKKYLYAIHTI